MSGTPDIILIGHGPGDALLLTLEAQRTLQQYGFAFTIGVPPRLAQSLRSAGVELEPLDQRVLAAEDPRDALLAAADVVLKQAEVESPVLVLVPENPLFLNSLSRFLLVEARDRELTVRSLPGVSQFDLLVNELGIDVAARGIQLFEAKRLLDSEERPNPRIPVVLLRLAGVMGDEVAPLAELRTSLAALYPGEHPVTLFNAGITGEGASHATGTLASIEEFAEHVDSGCSLFIGPIRE